MKKVLIALSAVVILTLLVACGEAEVSSSESTGGLGTAAPATEATTTLPPTSTTVPAEVTTTTTTGSPSTTTTAPSEPALTMDQEQAIAMGRDYLELSAFSRHGLIDQLVFEGFSKKDATFAVDYIAPDWNAQAEKMAQNYLELSAFSRQGLIDQLVFEGFTRAQAEHGVTAVGY